eukprot:Hpha_TRINITY_DN15346_c0_g2::TRINITY_DN15346_c0_g2_i1::g.87910::m.87910
MPGVSPPVASSPQPEPVSLASPGAPDSKLPISELASSGEMVRPAQSRSPRAIVTPQSPPAVTDPKVRTLTPPPVAGEGIGVSGLSATATDSSLGDTSGALPTARADDDLSNRSGSLGEGEEGDAKEDEYVVLTGSALPSEKWVPVKTMATEDRPCAAHRRHDFGPGLSSCAACGKSPTLNRGCLRCQIRLCSKCFDQHRQRGPGATRTDYEVLRSLGSGATAEVVLARARLSDKLFALKIMKKSPQPHGRREKTARRERDVMAKVAPQSPFLLRLHAAFQSGTRMFLVVDYMPGGDLYEYIRLKRRLPMEASQRAMAQVLEGLRALHAVGFVHRDIKPENVLLDERGNCKIADFGLTKDIESCKTFVGTDLYLAPELLGGGMQRRQPQSPASDLWAFGCLIVNCLTGGDPFPGDTTTVVYGAILRSAPRLYGAENTAAGSLILGLLKKNPVERFNGDQARAHPWFSQIKWDTLHEGVLPGWQAPPAEVPSRPKGGKGKALVEQYVDPSSDEGFVRDFSMTIGDLDQ